MQQEFKQHLDEARRQVEICNACRYCEGLCSVFPAAFSQASFDDADITQLANLCHNCRGCFYACQYTPPHEFALNLPKALAEVRQDSWGEFAFPQAFGRLFHVRGLALALGATLGFALIFALAKTLGTNAGGEGFYAVVSHALMVSIFMPAFLLPLATMAVSLRAYWRYIGGRWIKPSHLRTAFGSAATMKNLGGGQGQGCNFEDEDKFTNARRYAHQFTLYGFLLCFAATSTGTILHYGFDMHAPYAWWSLPKVFGVSGGILLSLGTGALIWLKLKADPNLGDRRVWGGEMAFVVLLFLIGVGGLALYWLGSTPLMPALLAFHLGTVLTLFLVTPYSKMVHGFYRLASLIRDSQRN